MPLLRAIHGGYEPIPLHGKRPYHDDWTQRFFKARDFERDDNVGIRTGRVIALDIDIDDTTINHIINDAVQFEYGGAVPTRWRADSSRRMYLFRTEDTDFLKVTRDLEHKGVRCRIEVLGKGQQFMAFGTHPDGAALHWDDWVHVDALSCISREELSTFLDQIIGDLGAEHVTYARFSGRPAVRLEQPNTMAYSSLVPPSLVEALNNLDPDDYGTWISTGMALKSSEEPWAYVAWTDWAAQSSKYPGEAACRGRWRGFAATRTSLDSLGRSAGVAVCLDQLDAIPDWIPPPPKALPAPPQIIESDGRKNYLSLDQWARKKPPSWLVKQLLPSNGLFSIVAASNVGKTFLLLDLMTSITENRDWFGLKTRAPEDNVAVMFAYEGSPIVRARGIHHKYGRDAGKRVIVLPGWPKLGSDESIDKVISVLGEIQAAEGPICMIAFDTLNLALQGANENSAEDMGDALRGLKRLQAAFRTAAVGVVHHLGKDHSKGGRGHSSLLGGIDTEIRITEDQASGIRRIGLAKSRDSNRGAGDIGAFVLQPCQVGMDEDGDPITSCYIDPKDVTMVKQDRDTSEREQVFKAIAEAVDAGQIPHQKWLVSRCGMKTERLLELLDTLEKEGLIGVTKGPKGAKIYAQI